MYARFFIGIVSCILFGASAAPVRRPAHAKHILRFSRNHTAKVARAAEWEIREVKPRTTADAPFVVEGDKGDGLGEEGGSNLQEEVEAEHVMLGGVFAKDGKGRSKEPVELTLPVVVRFIDDARAKQAAEFVLAQQKSSALSLTRVGGIPDPFQAVTKPIAHDRDDHPRSLSGYHSTSSSLHASAPDDGSEIAPLPQVMRADDTTPAEDMPDYHPDRYPKVTVLPPVDVVWEKEVAEGGETIWGPAPLPNYDDDVDLGGTVENISDWTAISTLIPLPPLQDPAPASFSPLPSQSTKPLQEIEPEDAGMHEASVEPVDDTAGEMRLPSPSTSASNSNAPNVMIGMEIPSSLQRPLPPAEAIPPAASPSSIPTRSASPRPSKTSSPLPSRTSSPVPSSSSSVTPSRSSTPTPTRSSSPSSSSRASSPSASKSALPPSLSIPPTPSPSSSSSPQQRTPQPSSSTSPRPSATSSRSASPSVSKSPRPSSSKSATPSSSRSPRPSTSRSPHPSTSRSPRASSSTSPTPPPPPPLPSATPSYCPAPSASSSPPMPVPSASPSPAETIASSVASVSGFKVPLEVSSAVQKIVEAGRRGYDYVARGMHRIPAFAADMMHAFR